MNEKLSTYLRHAITSIPALFAGLAANGFLTADEAAKLDADLKTFLIGLAAVLAAAITRWVMRLVAKHAPHLSNLFGGPAGGSAVVAMTTAAWGSVLLAGGILTSCVVGVDAEGGWSVRPDPKSIDAGLKYLIRHEDDGAKDGLTEWEYYDADTGKKIEPADYAAYGIEAESAE